MATDQSSGAAVVVVGARGVDGGVQDEPRVERERVGVGGVGALAVLLGARGVGLDVPEEPGIVAEQQRVGRVGVDHAAVVRVGRGAAVAAVLPPAASLRTARARRGVLIWRRGPPAPALRSSISATTLPCRAASGHWQPGIYIGGSRDAVHRGRRAVERHTRWGPLAICRHGGPGGGERTDQKRCGAVVGEFDH
jgi:hypothetical protein